MVLLVCYFIFHYVDMFSPCQNDPIQFCSQCVSKLPLPEEKHTEVDLQSSSQSGSLGSDKHKPNTSFDKKDSEQSMPFISTPLDNKLTKKNGAHVSDSSFENPFFVSVGNKSETEREHFTEQNAANDYDDGGINNVEFEPAFSFSHSSSFPSFDIPKEDFGSSLHNHSVLDDKSSHHQLKRLPSLDDYSGFSYPNLFTPQNSNNWSHTFR